MGICTRDLLNRFVLYYLIFSVYFGYVHQDLRIYEACYYDI